MANCPFLCARAWRIEHEVKGPRGCALGGIITAGIEPRINNTMLYNKCCKTMLKRLAAAALSFTEAFH